MNGVEAASVELLAIGFNHDPGTTADALGVRRNAQEFVAAPEWRRGQSVEPGDSVAAYALEATRGRTLTIQVRLRSLDPALRTFEVRAREAPLSPLLQAWLAATLEPLAPWPAYYVAAFQELYRRLVEATAPVLGTVRPRSVTVGPDGQSGFETFELDGPTLWTRGVGVDDVRWQWQFRRDPAGPWTAFAETAHRIYSVLAAPGPPWQSAPHDPANTQLPWTEVLDHACRWARGAHTRDEAAARITRAVYALGPGRVEYGCAIGGLSQYTALAAPFFFCTAFLERLRGGLGNGRYVNCTDCATIVSTFANALGCDLWQSRMGVGVVFPVNAIRTIGGTGGWTVPCSWPGFSMHEVAWEGACTASEEIFDACLEVDDTIDPTRPPHRPLLPANLRFGLAGERLYRDRLATPAGRALCEPQPDSRQRRFVV